MDATRFALELQTCAGWHLALARRTREPETAMGLSENQSGRTAQPSG